jgi:hypothetical protein
VRWMQGKACCHATVVCHAIAPSTRYIDRFADKLHRQDSPPNCLPSCPENRLSSVSPPRPLRAYRPLHACSWMHLVHTRCPGKSAHPFHTTELRCCFHHGSRWICSPRSPAGCLASQCQGNGSAIHALHATLHAL